MLLSLFPLLYLFLSFLCPFLSPKTLSPPLLLSFSSSFLLFSPLPRPHTSASLRVSPLLLPLQRALPLADLRSTPPLLSQERRLTLTSQSKTYGACCLCVCFFLSFFFLLPSLLLPKVSFRIYASIPSSSLAFPVLFFSSFYVSVPCTARAFPFIETVQLAPSTRLPFASPPSFPAS